MGVVGPWRVLFDFLFDGGIQSLGQSFRKGPGWRFVFIRRMGRRHGGWRYKRVKSDRLKYGTMRCLLGAVSGHRLCTIRHWRRFYIRFILTFIKHCFRMCRGRYVSGVWFGHFLSGGHLPATLCDNPTRNHAELAIIASWVTQLGIISSSVVPTSNC